MTLDSTTAAVEVTVRYFAGARAAAGVAEETVRVPGPTARAADVIDAAVDLHGAPLEKVVTACSFLLDGLAVRDRSVEVTGGAVLDVLPPFAGG